MTNKTSLFNITLETVAYNLQNNECLDIGNRFIIDSVPEFQFAVLNLLFSFIIKVMIVKYSTWLIGAIYRAKTKKSLLIPYPEYNKKKYPDSLGFGLEQVNFSDKVATICNIMIEFRIAFAIQYIIF